MRKTTLITMLCMLALQLNGQLLRDDSRLNSYVAFLDKQNTTAKEYIFDLFEKYDIIILCERDHRDMSQYNLIYDIVSDERFNGGNLLMEVGVSNMYDSINGFLQNKTLSEEKVEESLLNIMRHMDFNPGWEKTNYPIFLKQLHYLNRNLPAEKQVNVYPCDVPFSWDTVTSRQQYNRFMETRVDHFLRDGIMGAQMVDAIRKIDGKGKQGKVLAIMNHIHSWFMPNAVASSQVKKAYPDRTVNVLISMFRVSYKGSADHLIDDGRWDAAFALAGKKDLGFDLYNTPFGERNIVDYELKLSKYDTYKIQDFFHGFIFYEPIENHVLSMGYPNVVSKEFKKEMRRRNRVYLGKFKAFFVGSQAKYYNVTRTLRYKDMDKLVEQRNKWIIR